MVQAKTPSRLVWLRKDRVSVAVAGSINIEARKSPKLSRAAQEISRSPRLPMRKPSIGSPSLTRREFPFEDITQVVS